MVHSILLSALSHYNLSGVFLPGHLWLSHGEGNVAIFDHVHDLSLHCQTEENDEVEYENGPEHGHIEEFEESASNGE